MNKKSERSMTAGEIDLARSLFGAQIDYAKIKITSRHIIPLFQGRDCAAARGNSLSFPAHNYSDDFSKEKDPHKQSVFIHELAHVWQHQKGKRLAFLAIGESLRHAFNYERCYVYKLEPDRPLSSYGFEQQAAIIQDYFLLTRHGISASYKGRRTGENANLTIDYMKVISPDLAIIVKKRITADDKPSGPAPAA